MQMMHGTTDNELAEALDRRVRVLTRALRASHPRGTSTTSASVLGALRLGGPQRVTDLAARERVAQPTMTALIGRLEREGLVSRAPDPDDGRAVRVVLTPGGAERVDAVLAERATALAGRLGALDDGERETLAAALPVLDRLLDPTLT
jgi:DNA-binding MarR family transcriptional regulator